MKYLKDYPEHFEAWKQTQAELNKHHDLWTGHLEQFLFIHHLMALKPDAVEIICSDTMTEIFPSFDKSYDGLFYIYLFPFEADDREPESLPGDCPIKWNISFSEGIVICRDKSDAAEYCGVTIRQLERWMNGDRIREALPFFKHGRDRIFIEADLWSFMSFYGVGERLKHFNEYWPGDIRPIPKKG